MPAKCQNEKFNVKIQIEAKSMPTLFYFPSSCSPSCCHPTQLSNQKTTSNQNAYYWWPFGTLTLMFKPVLFKCHHGNCYCLKHLTTSDIIKNEHQKCLDRWGQTQLRTSPCWGKLQTRWILIIFVCHIFERTLGMGILCTLHLQMSRKISFMIC